MYFRFPVVREAEQQEIGNDFSFADGRIGLLEKLSAESENALGLHCSSRSRDSPDLLEEAWRSFRGDFPSVRRFVCLQMKADRRVRKRIHQPYIYIILTECCI